MNEPKYNKGGPLADGLRLARNTSGKPIDTGEFFRVMRTLHPSPALLKDIEAVEREGGAA